MGDLTVMYRWIHAGVLAGVSLTLLFAPTAQADWGTIKGRVVWGEDKIPPLVEAKVDKDVKDCLAKGKIYRDDLIINPKNKGVRNVLVWLGDPANAKNAAYAPAIHPDLKAVGKDVEIDQPCCVFQPRVVMLREGQNLIVKNTAGIPHNFAWTSAGINQLIPASGQLKVSGSKLESRALPSPYNCTIHTWMKGWIGVYKHPYFAVTDEDGKFEIKKAPAGRVRVMLWQESIGWVIQSASNPDDRGKVMLLKADGTADLGEVKMTQPKE